MPDGSSKIEDPGYSIAEAAAKLGYAPSTGYKLVAKKLLGCVRAPGMDARVFQSHIDEYKRRYNTQCPDQSSTPPTIGSSAGQAGASGTLLGPRKVKRSWSARELKLDLKAQSHRRTP